MAYKNAWIELDMNGYTPAQLLAFFAIEKGTPEWDALSRKRQLIKEAVWQANPELDPQGGIRMWRSKLDNLKYLLYVHVPLALAQEFAGLPTVIDENIRWMAGSYKDLPDAIHAEYWTGVLGERVILDPNDPAYDPNKNYPYFNQFFGIEP